MQIKRDYSQPFFSTRRRRRTGNRFLFLYGLFMGVLLVGVYTQFDRLQLAALDSKIVVKVPMTEDGVRAIKYFSTHGIKTNCTLVFSAGQALLAAKAGATYVSPFVGRLDDISVDGLALIREIRTIYDNYAFSTQILAASVRHSAHILGCARIGADVMTGPLQAIYSLLKHPLTDSGLAQFLADHQRVAAQMNN